MLKNIYDDYPTIKVVFTGSSLLEILNARADLSRRAVVYEMQGFSFREYLRMETGIDFDILSLEQILKNKPICLQGIKTDFVGITVNPNLSISLTVSSILHTHE